MRLAILMCLVVAGCASSGPIESAPPPQTVRVAGGATGAAIVMGMSAPTVDAHSATLSAPIAAVWRVLPAAYESLGIPLSMIDSTTRLVGNTGFNARRRLGSIPLVRLLECGTTQGGPSAETYDIRLSVITQVKADDAGTRLTTTVDAMGKPVAFSGEYIRCASTGVLEARIADAAKSRLAR
jgi:hypothetical protein